MPAPSGCTNPVIPLTAGCIPGWGELGRPKRFRVDWGTLLLASVAFVDGGGVSGVRWYEAILARGGVDHRCGPGAPGRRAGNPRFSKSEGISFPRSRTWFDQLRVLGNDLVLSAAHK